MISQKTKEKVLRIAKELNYEVNSSARSLSTKKTGVVGMIYQQELEDFGSSAYINELFLEFRHNLEALQLDTILLEAINPDTQVSNTVRLARQHKVDGFLFIHGQISSADFQYLQDMGIPAVQVHFKPQFVELSRLDYYLTENITGGRIATSHLIDRGCRRIVTLSCSPNIGGEFSERTEGYRQALTEAGIEVDEKLIFEMKTTYLTAYNFVHEHIELLRGCDGIFAQADILGSAVITALREHGIRVPRDMRVVGYDDSFYSTLVPPFLTTVHQPREEITIKACDRILELIKNSDERIGSGEPEQEYIEPYLIIREST